MKNLKVKEKDTRIPITEDILLKFFDKLHLSLREDKLVQTALVVAKACMLRSKEFTIDNGLPLKEQPICRWKHVRFIPCEAEPTSFVITLHKTKSSRNKAVQVGSICSCHRHRSTCPVHVLLDWKRTARPRSGSNPVFATKDGTILSRQLLAKIIKKLAVLCKLDFKKIKPHSLRIGGACDAFELDLLTLDEIKILGRWRSDSVLLYIRLQTKSILKALQKRLLKSRRLT